MFKFKLIKIGDSKYVKIWRNSVLPGSHNLHNSVQNVPETNRLFAPSQTVYLKQQY